MNKSLIQVGEEGSQARYRLLETIRQFAREQLHGSDQEADALERHARYYAQLVSRAAENQTGQTLSERLRTVQDDHDNLRGSVRMAACSRSRAGAGPGRAVGHGPEFLGTGRIFPGRASLAAACIGRHPGIGFAPAGTGPAGGGRSVLGDLRFRLWVAVCPASATAVSAARRSARGDRRSLEVLRTG